MAQQPVINYFTKNCDTKHEFFKYKKSTPKKLGNVKKTN